jgi:hypothetical protein
VKVNGHVLSEEYDGRLHGAQTTRILTEEHLSPGYMGLKEGLVGRDTALRAEGTLQGSMGLAKLKWIKTSFHLKAIDILG